jgi:uncharacterized repeat protein (TIGR02543 family)
MITPRVHLRLLTLFLALGLLGGCASQPATFTITYDANGGSTPPVDDAVYVTGSTATVLSGAGLTRAGDTFLHWNTESDGSGVSYPAGSTIVVGASDITLFAAWLSDARTFTITYDANGGTDPPVDSAAYATGSTAVVLLPGGVARDAYSFVGWNTHADGSGQAFLGGGTVTVGTIDITLYAMWHPHFFLAENGVTVMCPDAGFGDTGTVDGMEYTKRTRAEIRNNPTLAATSCTSGITDMAIMFMYFWDFNVDLSTWDTSNVTSMASMFEEAWSFDQDISAWDTSNVTNMSFMFQRAESFNQDLSLWCVEKIGSTPLGFDGGAFGWTTSRPVWGTCPSQASFP